ncbi:helix-turn-helix domain-containing protein [Desulfamplus magnetovallimortis]
MSLNTLSNLANNRFNPTDEPIEKFCRYFQCTPNDL